jgi:hypothetical protein
MATLPAAWPRLTAISRLTLWPAWSVPSSLLRLTCAAGALADQVTGPPTAVSVIGAVEPGWREMLPGDTARVPADALVGVTAGGGAGHGNKGAPGWGAGLVTSLMTASSWPPAVSVRTGRGDRLRSGRRGTALDDALAARPGVTSWTAALLDPAGLPLGETSTNAMAIAAPAIAAAAITPAPARILPGPGRRNRGRWLGWGEPGVRTAVGDSASAGNPDASRAAAWFAANSRFAESRLSSKKPSISDRASGERAGAGNRAKTRQAETLRGRFGSQTGQSPACSSTLARICGVIVPVQPLIASARSGQAWLPRVTRISAPSARSRSCLPRSSRTWASTADRPSTRARSTSCLQVSSSASNSSAVILVAARHAISRESASP